MPIFDFIAEKITRSKFRNITQTQEEALIDVLTAAEAIDGQLRDVERQELLSIIEKLEWKGSVPMATYVEQSIERATNIDPVPGELEDYFNEIAQRLDEDWLRQEAYYLASRIVLADDQIVENERLLLKYLVKAFDISSDRQQKIIQRIREEIGMV